MKLYRFSPITTRETLLDAIRHIHIEAYKLCWNTFQKHLPNSGNVGVFCHYETEYEYLTGLRKEITEASENYNQKYFRLHNPIIETATPEIPKTKYEFLYIRQPDPYRHHVGDIDFFLPENEYQMFKSEIEAGKKLAGARVFPSPHLDMIELFHPDSDVLAYVSTTRMTDIVKTTKSGA